MHIPPYDNQQVPQVNQDKKNGKNTPLLGSPVSSIAAADLWPLWLENPFVFTQKKSSLTGNTWEDLQWIRLHQKAPEGACFSFKVLTLARAKMSELIILYVGVYGGT